GRTASANSTPACSSSIWPSWHYYSEDREQVLRQQTNAVTMMQNLRHGVSGARAPPALRQ
ncbi:hypothetical protein, partial [Xanthomonas campestris]|uniref:hypothetical protein n=1 Tax=Xanthomonas campestris TaxID=339 RepID=UPI0036DC9F73